MPTTTTTTTTTAAASVAATGTTTTMGSSAPNNANNSKRDAPFAFRPGTTPRGEEDSSDLRNNNRDSPETQPSSAFSHGLKGRTPPSETGLSDDSDLPRLSPIRTSSGTALNTWEKKHKLLTVPRDNQLGGRCGLSRSCFYEEQQIYKRPDALFMVNGGGGYGTGAGRDSSDLSLLLGSHEESMTATSGACSTLSEDVWQNSSASENFGKMEEEARQEAQEESEQAHVQGQQQQQHQRSKSNLSSFFDNLTTTLNRGLYNLALKVERATTTAAREISTGLRSAAVETKPDTAFFAVHETPKILSGCQPNDHDDDSSSTAAAKKEGKEYSPVDSAVSAAIPIGRTLHTRAISYDTSFNLCGGQELYEQLEFLCNEYAKKLNKLRTRLSDVDKSRLDEFVMHMYPIFDVVGSPSESDDDNSVQSVDERLSFLYIPVDMMVGQCLHTAAQKERSSVMEIANLVANPVNVLGSASQIPLTPQTSRCAELYVELDSAVEHGKHSVELIHEDGVRRIAELSSSCVSCLLELTQDLTQCLDSETNRINWPSDGTEIGQLLRSFVIRLVHNMESVTGSFVGALLGLGSAYDENLQDCCVGQKAQGLACDLELDSGTAVMKIQESLRNLMYVVVYVTFES